MRSDAKGMRSIWFFVGLILVCMGALVLLGGLLEAHPVTRLGYLRPAIWWGGIMVVSGAAFLVAGRRREMPGDEGGEGDDAPRREEEGVGGDVAA